MGKSPDDYNKEIVRGILECVNCGQKYPVVNSIQRMYTGAEKNYEIYEL